VIILQKPILWTWVLGPFLSPPQLGQWQQGQQHYHPILPENASDFFL